MKQRIREAVVRIAKTDANRVASLPFLEKSLLPVLSLASVLYSASSYMRRLLYRYSLFTPTRLSVPVVSVGNITWGGNGKTPMVEFLAGCFLRAGICPLILTRGYAGGDEARLLQSHLEGSCTKIGVGPNRAAIASSALEQHGVLDTSDREQMAELMEPCSKVQLPIFPPGGDGRIGIIILDDGMQHWQLARNLEIVMVNLISLWGNKLMVPRGPLRESLKELRRADVVILHHADLVSEESIKSAKDTLGSVMRAGSVVVLSRMAPLYLFRPPTSGVAAQYSQHVLHKCLPPVSLNAIKGSVVLCATGVGSPESVSLVLEQMGPIYVERMDYPDHHVFEDKELNEISVKYIELQQRFPDSSVLLVLTEKDYVRDPEVWTHMKGVELLVLHSSLEILPVDGDLKALTRILSNVVSSRVQGQSKPPGGTFCLKYGRVIHMSRYARFEASEQMGNILFRNVPRWLKTHR